MNHTILDFATNREKIYLVGLTKLIRPWNGIPVFQRFQIARVYPRFISARVGVIGQLWGSRFADFVCNSVRSERLEPAKSPNLVLQTCSMLPIF